MLNTKNLCQLSLSAAGLMFLVSCGGSSSDSGAITTTSNAPFISASCTGARTATSSCGSDAAAAFYSVYPGAGAKKRLNRDGSRETSSKVGCEDLQSLINANGELPTPLLTSTSPVHCTGGVCTANPTNVWYDKDGKAVASFPAGSYTIFVRFSNDPGATTTFKPSDAFICKDNNTIDNDHLDVSVAGGSGENALPVSIPSGPTPSTYVHCNNGGTPNCSVAANNAAARLRIYKDTTCAQIKTEVESNYYVTTPYTAEFSFNTGKGISVSCVAGSKGGNGDNCTYQFTSGAEWNDGASNVTTVPAGTYSALSIITPLVSQNPTKSRIGDTYQMRPTDIIQCQDGVVVDPVTNRGSTIYLVDHPLAPTFPSLINPTGVDANCSYPVTRNPVASPDCDFFALNSVGGGSFLVKDQTCAQVVTSLETGLPNSVKPTATSSSTVSCDDKSAAGCHFTTGEWSNGVAAGSYALVGLMDRFNDINVVHTPDAGDLVQCQDISIGVRGNYSLGDGDIKTVNWKDHVTPTINLSCDSSINSGCTEALQTTDTLYFTMYNTSCADIAGAITGANHIDLSKRFIGMGGNSFCVGATSCDTDKGKVDEFGCNVPKGKTGITCSNTIKPWQDMVYFKDSGDSVPYKYFRDGGPITVVTAVNLTPPPPKAGAKTVTQIGFFCKQFSTWDATTTSVSLDSSNLSILSEAPGNHFLETVRNSAKELPNGLAR